MYFTQYTDYALRSLMYVAALVKKVFWNVCAAKAAACMGRQKQRRAWAGKSSAH